MVDMKVCQDEILDRLAWNFCFNGLHDGDGSFFKERRFHQDNVVLHLHSHAVMVAPFHVIYALCDFEQLHFLLAAKVLISNTHDDASKRPLRNDAFTDFSLGTDFGRDREAGVFILRIVDKSTYAFLADFVPI